MYPFSPVYLTKKDLSLLSPFSFFLSATWILLSSQIEPLSFVDNNYPAPSLASTMTCATSKALKNSSTLNTLTSKNKLKNKKTKRGAKIISFSSSSSKELTGGIIAQSVVIFSPPGKTPNKLSQLWTDGVVNLASDDLDKFSDEDEVDTSTAQILSSPRRELPLMMKVC